MPALALYGRRRDALSSIMLFLAVALLGFAEMRLADWQPEAAGISELVRVFVVYPSLTAAVLLLPWFIFPRRAVLTLDEEAIEWRGYPGFLRQRLELAELRTVGLTEKGRYVALGYGVGLEMVIGYSFGLTPAELAARIEAQLPQRGE